MAEKKPHKHKFEYSSMCLNVDQSVAVTYWVCKKPECGKVIRRRSTIEEL